MSIWDTMNDAWAEMARKRREAAQQTDDNVIDVEAHEKPIEEPVQPTEQNQKQDTIRMFSRQESSFQFPEDMTEAAKTAVTVIGSMSEDSPEQKAVKALEWKYYSQPDARESMSMVGTQEVSADEVQNLLKELHGYDADGGAAWEASQSGQELTGSVKADFQTYGLETKMRHMMATGTSTPQAVQDEVDDKAPKWGLVTVSRKDLVPTNQDGTWEDGYSDAFAGTRTMGADGMVTYSGALGDFQYDPTQFQLQVVQVDADEFGNPATSYPILKYIGSEVDGKYIKIPEGLKDASFMFEGNKDLESVPHLPSSLETAFGMFKDCEQLRNAGKIALPNKLQETQFMFANCQNLTIGPRIVNAKDATGMFANCTNLLNTPVIAPGLKCADSMFAGCENLSKKPKFPFTVKFADYATMGCTGIDEAEKAREQKALEKSQQKFEKQQTRKSLGDHLGRVFSACMQVHAMSKSGHNIVHALMLTKSLRKSGMLSRDMAGGWEAMYKANRSGFNQYMMVTSRQNAQKKAAKDAERYKTNTEAFQATNMVRKESSKADRAMFMNGQRAMRAGFFEKVDKHGFAAAGVSYMAAKADADELRSVLSFRAEYGGVDAKAKSYYAKKATDLVSQQVAYYKGGEAVLQEKPCPVKDVNMARNGLERMQRMNIGELMNGIRDAQKTSQFMNERQMSTIFQMVEQTPYGKSEEYKQLKEQMQSEAVGRAQFAKVEQEAMMNTHRRQTRMRTESGVNYTRPEPSAANQGTNRRDREVPDIVKETNPGTEKGMSL